MHSFTNQTASSLNVETLPLIYDGDAYSLDVVVSELLVVLHAILRYEGNRNCTAVSIKFFDLSPDARRAVLHAVQRRFEGRTVKV